MAGLVLVFPQEPMFLFPPMQPEQGSERLPHNRVIQDYNEYTSGVHSSMEKARSGWCHCGDKGLFLQFQDVLLLSDSCQRGSELNSLLFHVSTSPQADWL